MIAFIKYLLKYIHVLVSSIPVIFSLLCVCLWFSYESLSDDSILGYWTITFGFATMYSLVIWLLLSIVRAFLLKEKVFTTYYAYFYYIGILLFISMRVFNPGDIMYKVFD